MSRPNLLNTIQWDGSIESAEKVYAFIGKPYERLLVYHRLVDGQPVFDPLMGGPVLHFKASEGDMWLQPKDWITKSVDGFTLIRESDSL